MGTVHMVFAACTSSPIYAWLIDENVADGVMDPTPFVSELQDAIAAWNDDDLAIGTEPGLTYGGVGEVADIDTTFYLDKPGVYIVVLTESKWQAKNLPDVLASLALLGGNGADGFHQVLWVRGSANWEDSLPSMLAPPPWSEYSMEAMFVGCGSTAAPQGGRSREGSAGRFA